MGETTIVKALVVNDGKLLLLKKVGGKIDSHKGCWEAPGGKVETGCDLKDELMRELSEEIGMQGKIIKSLAPWSWKHGEISEKCNVYLVEIENQKIVLSDEHSDFIWIEPRDMEKMENIIFKEKFIEYLREAELI